MSKKFLEELYVLTVQGCGVEAILNMQRSKTGKTPIYPCLGYEENVETLAAVARGVWDRLKVSVRLYRYHSRRPIDAKLDFRTDPASLDRLVCLGRFEGDTENLVMVEDEAHRSVRAIVAGDLLGIAHPASLAGMGPGEIFADLFVLSERTLVRQYPSANAPTG